MTFVGSELAVRCRYHEWLPGKGDRASVPARTLHDLPHTPLQEGSRLAHNTIADYHVW
jgi:hypothetical protein